MMIGDGLNDVLSL